MMGATSWQRHAWRAVAVFVAALPISMESSAQVGKLAPPASSVSAFSSKNDEGPRWQSLNAAQRVALAPLEKNWPGLNASAKQRWLAVVARFPSIAPPERARIQGQMTDWAKLSPAERGQARLRFQEAKQVPAMDRQKRWQDYQALPPEQRQQLAARAQNAASAGDSHVGTSVSGKTTRSPSDSSLTKLNVVPNPALSASPKSVAPALVQARPGATTTLLTKTATPPAHQQTGMPKIAATPEFIDKSTLLPKRGAQAAGVSAMAPEPLTTPH